MRDWAAVDHALSRALALGLAPDQAVGVLRRIAASIAAMLSRSSSSPSASAAARTTSGSNSASRLRMSGA